MVWRREIKTKQPKNGASTLAVISLDPITAINAPSAR
jgi:hypothetical protein